MGVPVGRLRDISLRGSAGSWGWWGRGEDLYQGGAEVIVVSTAATVALVVAILPRTSFRGRGNGGPTAVVGGRRWLCRRGGCLWQGKSAITAADLRRRHGRVCRLGRCGEVGPGRHLYREIEGRPTLKLKGREKRVLPHGLSDRWEAGRAGVETRVRHGRGEPVAVIGGSAGMEEGKRTGKAQTTVMMTTATLL